jgi:ribosomal protein L20A (L18A)
MRAKACGRSRDEQEREEKKDKMYSEMGKKNKGRKRKVKILSA